MNLPKVVPPREFLQECFSYDPEAGTLTWKERPRSHFKWDYAWIRFTKRNAGKSALIKSWRDPQKEYPRSCVVKLKWNDFPAMYPSHRIIYGLLGLEIPEGHYVDHINGDPHDNRLSNLRLATPSQNSQNKRNQRDRKHNLPKGVFLHRTGKFGAKVMVEGKSTYLGCFDTAEEAHAKYCAVALVLHGDFHRAS